MRRSTGFGIALLGLMVVLAVVGPAMTPDPLVADHLATGALLGPSSHHWLGTDQFARDVLARLAGGARVSLEIAVIAVAVAAAIGSWIGLASGWFDGPIGGLLRGVINVGLALPRIVVLLVVLATVGRVPPPMLGLILGATGWPAIARLVRGETLRLKHAPFVGAACALGAAGQRVLWRDVFPGTLPAVLVAATLGLADVILLEAGLSFIGVGVPPPQPSWGGMIFDARAYLLNDPWLLIFPALALVITTSGATLLGDALRRSLHPGTA